MLSQTGGIREWNGSPDLGSYFPAPCNDLYGSAEGTFPTSDTTTISYFSSDLCRPLTFTRGRDNNYWLEGEQFANSSYSETAWCYNPQPDLIPDYYDLPSRPLGAHPNLHLPSGLINISACTGGSPQYVSQPHFYQAEWTTCCSHLFSLFFYAKKLFLPLLSCILCLAVHSYSIDFGTRILY